MVARAARVCFGVSKGVTELTASPSRPTIIVADDHGQVLEEIVHLLQQEFEILAAVSDGALEVRAVGDLKPQVAALDIGMPVMNGFEAAEQITKMGIPTKIVLLV